ncbi:hypothetical protein ABVT39_018170 [Epinephelus coioides]
MSKVRAPGFEKRYVNVLNLLNKSPKLKYLNKDGDIELSLYQNYLKLTLTYRFFSVSKQRNALNCFTRQRLVFEQCASPAGRVADWLKQATSRATHLRNTASPSESGSNAARCFTASLVSRWF